MPPLTNRTPRIRHLERELFRCGHQHNSRGVRNPNLGARSYANDEARGYLGPVRGAPLLDSIKKNPESTCSLVRLKLYESTVRGYRFLYLDSTQRLNLDVSRVILVAVHLHQNKRQSFPGFVENQLEVDCHLLGFVSVRNPRHVKPYAEVHHLQV